MPIANYGVFKGKAVEMRRGAGQQPHYQIRAVDESDDFRFAVNVMSQVAPSEVEYLIDENFHHPITTVVGKLRLGFTGLASKPGSGALDFIRGNLFDRSLVRPLPANVPGLDNDLQDRVDRVIQRAMATEDSLVYAFGQRWGPESKKDKYFGFKPGNGVHDIHMNQGNSPGFAKDDGVWQDGGLLVEFPSQHQWISIFLKFQSQTWHTDDATGHALAGAHLPGSVPPGDVPVPSGPENPILVPTDDEPNGLVRIVAALVNATPSPEVETVTILNTSPHTVPVDGWRLLDTHEHAQALSGSLDAGQSSTITVEKPVELSNKGGVITLVDENGLKVDGVAYTKAQASQPGWTIVF